MKRPGSLPQGQQPQLLLYSEGVTEARDGHTEFSEARLRALLAATTPDAHVVVDVIIQAALTHCGGPTGR